MSDDSGQDDSTDNSNDNSPSKTEINASLASLDISVSTEGQEECEQLFYRVWDYVNEDAEEMSDAMRERLV